MNNKSAAGLRRSAVVERIRLREEWSALKGTENQLPNKEIVRKKPNQNWTTKVRTVKNNVANSGKENKTTITPITSEALRGVVALVEVGSASRALALRAALTALGASVTPKWSPLVTHLIWSQGGCRAIRSRARALACRLVSPLWVEACAGAARRLPETAFPAAPRESDLPSPRTLRQLLKKAEMENVSLLDLINDQDEEETRQMRLRISTESEANTSSDVTINTTKDKSEHTIDIQTRINTAPRRALPVSISPRAPARSRRKLFTQKEPVDSSTESESDEEVIVKTKITQKERRNLATAERMAKKLLYKCTQPNPRVNVSALKKDVKYRIVLTGVNRSDMNVLFDGIRSLGGRIQSKVNKMTTHVVLGSCCDDLERTEFMSGVAPNATNLENLIPVKKPRTLNALSGAARGCRVLTAAWAAHSIQQQQWQHHVGYEVPYLKKMSQKARLERIALGKENSEYAFDIFNGMRVFVSETTAQHDCATQLLSLCGAAVTQDVTEVDIILGTDKGNVCSKWVFDSIAAARMRTVRRYKV